MNDISGQTCSDIEKAIISRISACSITCLLCLLTYSFSCYGDVYLNSYQVSAPVLESGQVKYDVTVYYRIPYHDDDNYLNREEFSHVGITDQPIGQGEFKSELSNLQHFLNRGSSEGLPGFLSKTNSLRVRGSGTKGETLNYNLGYWPPRKNPINRNVYATFTLWLKKEKIEQVNEFCFYVVAQEWAKEEADDDDYRSRDDGPYFYRDSLNVCLPGFSVAQAKISGLSDIALTDNNLSTVIDTCVYSTTGKARLEFDSLNTRPRTKFRLLNGSHHKVFYTLSVRQGLSGNNWKELVKEGASNISDVSWQVNDSDENCNGTRNISFRVTATAPDNKPAGIYSDTMTVTVSPE